MNEHYHHGITIREYRQKRGMTQLELAERWPTGPVNLRYVQYIEKGAKQIVDQHLLRQLSDLLDIRSGDLAFLPTILFILRPCPDTANACIKKPLMWLNPSSNRPGVCAK